MPTRFNLAFRGFEINDEILHFPRPTNIFIADEANRYSQLRSLRIGTLTQDIFSKLHSCFFPPICSQLVRERLCLSTDVLEKIGTDRFKIYDDSTGYFLENIPDRLYRLYLWRNDLFIADKILKLYDVERLILTFDRTQTDFDNSSVSISYDDLRRLYWDYERCSTRIRKEVSSTLINNIFLNQNTELSFSPQGNELHETQLRNSIIESIKLRNREFIRLVRADGVEKKYELFLKKYPWLLNIHYVGISPATAQLNDIDHQTVRYTDIYLAQEVYGTYDIWELKRPRHQVFRKNEYRRGVFALTSEVSGAVNQVKHYLELFKKNCNSIYKLPQGYVLVGNLQVEANKKGVPLVELQNNLRMYNHTLHDVKILTYDMLIAQNENLSTHHSVPVIEGAEGEL